MELNKVRKNSKVVEDGDWVTDLPGMGDLRLLVRGANSRQVRRALGRKIAENLENQKDEARERVTAEVYAECVLLDWDNLTDNGTPVPFDRELALRWLLDPDMDDFYNAVEQASLEVSRKSKEAVEELAKN